MDEELRTRVTRFLDSVDVFLELLLSVRALPEGEEFADDRVIATVCPHYDYTASSNVLMFTWQLRLMNFIRRIGRDEIYIKYVHQLVNVGVSVTSIKVATNRNVSDAPSVTELRRGRPYVEAACRSP